MTVKETILEFDKVTGEVKVLFGNLSFEQLNWKPAPEKWSIAQCLDHLIVSNQTYYPQLKEVISGNHRNSPYQSMKFVSRFFGSYLIKETGQVVSKPMKHPGAFTPSQSELTCSIVSDFAKHQHEFTSYVMQLEKADLENTVISSPALKIITYNLKDLLTILVGHEQRHLIQAKKVLNHPKFPN
jgi:uncharacterized damage-inducible protein DinB